MFKSILSFKFTNTNPSRDITTSTTSSAIDKTIVNNNDEGTTDNSSLIQLVRQQRQQKLEETALIRKIAHQSFMSHYEQDNLPLSQVQEKLEEDNLPLVQLQQKLKQRKDNLTVYTTTKESLKSLFYDQRKSYNLLMKPRKSRPRPTVVINSHSKGGDDNGDDNKNINSTNDNVIDDRDYDVWDDVIIGRIMNLVDTIGAEEVIQGTESTMIDGNITENKISTLSENTSENVKEKNDSKDIPKDKVTIVVERVQENCENESTKVVEEMINHDKILSVADDRKLSNESMEGKNATVIEVTTLTTTLSVERSDNLIRDSGYGGENSTPLSVESNDKRESRSFGKRHMILPSFFNNKNDDDGATIREVDKSSTTSSTTSTWKFLKWKSKH